MFSDNRFERSLFTQSRGKFGAEHVKMSFRPGFFEALGLDQAAKLGDLFGDAGDALRHRFEFKGKLSTLAAEGFHLEIRVGDFTLKTAGLAIRAREAFFSLRELVAQPRRRRHGLKDGAARLLLLAF